MALAVGKAHRRGSPTLNFDSVSLPAFCGLFAKPCIRIIRARPGKQIFNPQPWTTRIQSRLGNPFTPGPHSLDQRLPVNSLALPTESPHLGFPGIEIIVGVRLALHSIRFFEAIVSHREPLFCDRMRVGCSNG